MSKNATTQMNITSLNWVLKGLHRECLLRLYFIDILYSLRFILMAALYFTSWFIIFLNILRLHYIFRAITMHFCRQKVKKWKRLSKHFWKIFIGLNYFYTFLCVPSLFSIFQTLKKLSRFLEKVYFSRK